MRLWKYGAFSCLLFGLYFGLSSCVSKSRKDKVAGADKKISHVVIADIEGSVNKIKTAVEGSSVLEFDEKKVELKFKEGSKDTKVVFLGDIVKEKKSHAVLKAVVEFAEKNKDRVQLVIGNRDIILLRFIADVDFVGEKWKEINLSDNPGSARIKPTPGRDWDFKAEITGKNKKKYTGYASASGDEKAALNMKLLLAKTMGSPKFFNDLKSELGLKTDVETYKKIMELIEKDGLYHRYLKMAKIIVHDGSFVASHGAVTKDNWLMLPPETDPGRTNSEKTDKGWRKSKNLKEWVKDINSLKDERVGLVYKENKTAEDKEKIEGLFRLGEPERRPASGGGWMWEGNKYNNLLSIIQNIPFDRRHDKKDKEAVYAFKLSGDLVQKLKKELVKFWFSGHSPVGPVPFMEKKDGVTLVYADTTFAKRNARIEVGERVNIVAKLFNPKADPGERETKFFLNGKRIDDSTARDITYSSDDAGESVEREVTLKKDGTETKIKRNIWKLTKDLEVWWHGFEVYFEDIKK